MPSHGLAHPKTIRRHNWTGPRQRSGHRVFVTDDFLYVVGGFSLPDMRPGASTFRDIWKMNLATYEWRCVRCDGAFSDTMASFSLTYVPELAKFYVYGGSGHPFGQAVSDVLYECALVDDDRCVIRALPVTGERPPPAYGQSTAHCFDAYGHLCVFLVGGTRGIEYHMHVYKLVIEDGQAHSILMSTEENEPMPRYRHETFLHDNKLLSLGGCNSDVYCSFETCTVFDLATQRFEMVHTYADPRCGYPIDRKGHALVKFGSRVCVFGGLNRTPSDEQPARLGPENVDADVIESVLDDIWTLDLTSMIWTKAVTRLPIGVFFHSAAVTLDGRVYSYGGCKCTRPAPLRTKKTFIWSLQPPRLDWLCARAVIDSNIEHFLNIPRLALSTPLNIVRRATLDDRVSRRRECSS